MIRTISPADMKRVENRVMSSTAITGEALMQRAAAHVAAAVGRLRRQRGGMVLCLCGTGNNGGDGLAAMRMLAQADDAFRGQCWLLPGALSPDARRELDRLEAEAGAQVSVRLLREEELPAFPANVDCAVDALFGTGLSRPLEGLAKRLCEGLTACRAPVVAVDIPSGLHGETGDVLGAAVEADCTVTFHRPKHGLYLKNGPDCAGEIVVADIGLNAPEAAALDDAQGMWLLERGDLNRLLPSRRRNTHKGSYGRVVLLAGSRGMAGAAAISALAALRSGAGLVTVACPDGIVDVVQTLCPCATCLPLAQNAEEAWAKLEAALERADAIGAGCGLGQSAWAQAMVDRLSAWLARENRPAVLDADALNLTARSARQNLGAHTFVTPHPAEAARLLHAETAQVLDDAPAAARRLARDLGVSALVKGACSVLCAKEGMALNPYGTPGMAKGGSGDALTGTMAALLAGRAAGAYRMNDLELMQTACALHGMAGEMAAQRYGQSGMLATDLCECIGLVRGDEAQAQEPPPASPKRRKVTVVVEHPAGSHGESDRRFVYRLNCGYVQQVLHEQNRWQDACLLFEAAPLEWMDGVAVASAQVGQRSVWAVAAGQADVSEQDIRAQLAFLGTIDRVEMF